jgi:hypothetical protein
MALFPELFPDSRRRISFTLKCILRIHFRCRADVSNVISQDIAVYANTKNSHRRLQNRSYETASIVQLVLSLAVAALPSLAVAGFSLLATTSGPFLWQTQEHNKLISGALSPGVRRLKSEAVHSAPSSTEIRKHKAVQSSVIRYHGMILN